MENGGLNLFRLNNLKEEQKEMLIVKAKEIFCKTIIYTAIGFIIGVFFALQVLFDSSRSS